MLKQLLTTLAMLFAVLTITGCLQYEPESAYAAETAASYRAETSSRNDETANEEQETFFVSLAPLWFHSLEEFLETYAATTGRGVSQGLYLERMASYINSAPLNELYLLTNLPEAFQLADIVMAGEGMSIRYAAVTGDDAIDSQHIVFRPHFTLGVSRFTHEDLDAWGHTSPLDGIMRQFGFTEKDLIDGRYYFHEGILTRTLYWAQGSQLVSLRLPRLEHGNNEVSAFSATDLGLTEEMSVRDMLQFTETVTLDLQDERNIAAWSAGDFTMVDALLESARAEARTSTIATETENTPQHNNPAELRFTVGSNAFLHDGAARQAEAVPFISEGRTMVPLRIIAEALGAEVNWDNATRTVTIATREEKITLTVDVPLPDDMGTPIIVNGLTFVPVRYVSETLGASVRWDGENNAVYVYGTDL